MTTTETDRHRAAIVELIAEAGELLADAEADLASAEGMPPGPVRDEAVRIARSNVDAHADRVEVLRMARKLFEAASRQGQDIAAAGGGNVAVSVVLSDVYSAEGKHA